jgi:hypothetical protein
VLVVRCWWCLGGGDDSVVIVVVCWWCGVGGYNGLLVRGC